MKIISAILFFSFIYFITACAQTRQGIQSARAFYQISQPGNIPVDEAGNPLKRPTDTLRVIYLETVGKNRPEIERVTYGNRRFHPELFAEEKIPVRAGTEKGNEKVVWISPRRGNTIWRVELTAKGAEVAVAADGIILRGKLNGRMFVKTIKRELELEREIRP